VVKIFHFGRFDIGMFALHLGVLTTPSTAPRSPPSWRAPTPTATAQGRHARASEYRAEQGAAVERLGSRHAHARAAELRGLRCPEPARAADPAGRHAGARRTGRTGASLLRLPTLARSP
jgi:hypothetical protein